MPRPGEAHVRRARRVENRPRREGVQEVAHEDDSRGRRTRVGGAQSGQRLRRAAMPDDGGQVVPRAMREVGIEEFAACDLTPDQSDWPIAGSRSRMPLGFQISRVVVEQGYGGCHGLVALSPVVV